MRVDRTTQGDFGVLNLGQNLTGIVMVVHSVY